jgi:hypothetical protein
MIRPHEPFLYVGILKPVLHLDATEHEIDARAKIARTSVDLLLPMGEHALTGGVELATDVPEDGMLSALVALARDLAILEQLVEDASVRSIEVVFPGDALLAHVFLCLGRIYLFSRYVQVASQNDALPHLGKIPDAGIQRGNKAVAEVVSKAIAVGRTVDTEEYESREFEHQAAALCVERRWIDPQGSDLGRRRITTNTCVFWQISILGGRPGRTEHT